MILKLIKKILAHFNYEVVHFAEMEFYCRAVNQRAEIATGKHNLTYCIRYIEGAFNVQTVAGSPVFIVVKKFYASDYGSIDYARACACELCDKLNERP